MASSTVGVGVFVSEVFGVGCVSSVRAMRRMMSELARARRNAVVMG